MLSKELFEEVMYDQTEWPGESIPLEDVHLISHRYNRALEFCEDKDVLEVGGGSTIGKAEIARKVKSYVGIDIASKNLQLSSHLCEPNVMHLCKADAHYLPFRDSSFDSVFALAMVYYLDSKLFLAEVRRVLRPGGHLYFCTSNKDVPGFTDAPGSREYFGLPEWKKILSVNGFAVSFEGVFKKDHALPLGIRAWLIAKIKGLIASLGLMSIWRLARYFAKGKRVAIPATLEEFPVANEMPQLLSGEAPDTTHRVIYCICRLEDGSGS